MKTSPKRITTGTVSISFSAIAIVTALLLPILTVVLPEPISLGLFLPSVTAVLVTGALGVLIGALPRDLPPRNRIGIGIGIVAFASMCFIIYA